MDPAEKARLLDLFTVIAILERLIHNWLEPAQQIDAAEFSVLNFFCRLGKVSETVDGLALCFQLPVEQMRVTVASLASRALLDVGDQPDPVVRVTAAGCAEHDRAIMRVAPDVMEVVSEIDPDHIRITAETLKELRRTIDNLPGR